MSAVIAACSCGWSGSSATRPGAVVLADAHLAESGLQGHLVTVGGAR